MNRYIEKFYNLITRTYTFVYGLLYPIEKKVVFYSFGGKQYSDNPRAISEKLHELYPDYEIKWILNDDKDKYGIIPEYVKILIHKPHSFPIYKEIATCFCFVNNFAYTDAFYKRKGQLFIQTWHGDIAPKKVLYDIPSERISAPISVADNRITDICIAGSDIGEKVYRTAFRYNGKVLKVGMPRNDKLINVDINNIEIVKKALGIDLSYKILLYAPTFRDNNRSNQMININLSSVIDSLENTGEKWVCLIRAHAASKGLANMKESENVINVSDYPDMADLLQISDMLITDYSSCAGDFIIKRKPTILTFFDYDDYVNNCREFNFSCEKAGFIIVRNNEELIRTILSYTETDYVNSCEQIIKYFNIVMRGNSSSEVVEYINSMYVKKLRISKGV